MSDEGVFSLLLSLIAAVLVLTGLLLAWLYRDLERMRSMLALLGTSIDRSQAQENLFQELGDTAIETALNDLREYIFDAAPTIFRERDLNTFTLPSDIRAVDGVLCRFLQVSHSEPMYFERQEVNTGTIHYQIPWPTKETHHSTLDIWLRLGRNEFTYISWKDIRKPYDSSLVYYPHPSDRAFDLTMRKFFALFEFFYYIDQLRMAILADSSKLTIARLAIRLEQAKDDYRRYDKEEGQATHEWIQYEWEQETVRSERMAAYLLPDENGEQLEKLNNIMSGLSDKVGILRTSQPRTRGRPSETEYDEIFEQYSRGAITQSEATKAMINLGASKEAARKALQRRRKREGSLDEGRNSSKR